MKPTITRFNDKTGDFEITIPVPFTLKDGIEYVDMMAADIPKYEDTKDYNVFDLIRENQELKKQLSNSHQIKNQQKEFMEYLEEPIKIITEGNPTNISEYTSAKLDTLKEVLQKYKEIVGGLDDKN